MPERITAAKRTEQAMTQSDRRADAGERRIKLTRDDVLISRRLAGISMLITVPITAYRGVALDVSANAAGSAAYRLSLAHRDPDLDIVLAETQDGGAIAADWKYWATYLNLPRLGGKDGDLEPVGAPAAIPVRRGAAAAALKGRRSRFARRRKLGMTARAETVFADEREIICYE